MKNTLAFATLEGPMRRIGLYITIAALAAVGAFAAVASPAVAQTGDTASFCAARLDGNDAQGKAANLAVMNRAVRAAPAGVVTAITQVRDAYKKQGDKLFNTPAGIQMLTQLDAWVYDNCGAKVSVAASDYQFTGIPATLPAGVTTFKMTNTAPQEQHMMAIMKMKPAAQGQDLTKLLQLPEKKQGKYFEESGGTFAQASPGDVGYAPIDLTPGTYAYACFFPQGGKKNGTPHFMLGMEGSFIVQ
jgi:hypothetical protein